MNLSDACGVVGLIGMGLLLAALVLSIIRKIAERRGRMQRAEAMQRYAKLFLIFGTGCWFLACLLAFAMASQSNH